MPQFPLSKKGMTIFMTKETHLQSSLHKKRKTPRPRAEGAVGETAAFFPSLLRAAVLALGCGIVLILLSAFLCLKTEDPSRNAPYFAAGIRFLSALLAGLLSGRFTGKKGLLSGLLAGGLYVILLAGLSLCLPATGGHGITEIFLQIGICLFLSMSGGYLSTHKKPKKKKLRRQ